MYRFCVFAGTTEGRETVDFLCRCGAEVTACVATEYGGTLLSPCANLTILTGRLSEAEMEALLRREHFDLVIDATHPYAVFATESIAAACGAAGTEYLRVLRGDDLHSGRAQLENAVFVENAEAAVAFLNQTGPSILLTTGSKEIQRYTGITNFAKRVYARVLPMAASLRSCEEAGLAPSHIIAMQGPFSVEMNAATLRAVNAAYLVTKDSGDAGGFWEKAAAAREAGAVLIVIGRPPQRDGVTFHEMVKLLCKRFGFSVRPQVAVVGIGMGNRATMTVEAQRALKDADCVIGAARMLAACGAAVSGETRGANSWGMTRSRQLAVEAVRAEDIAARIREHPECRRFAIAMSGDTGFFSGAKKLLPLLADCDVRVLPGVSSLSYFCARLCTSYEDIKMVSLHGRARDILADVRENRRVFALTGGANSVQAVCARLTENGFGDVRVCVGERLGYPEERIEMGTARELAPRTFDELSVMLIENAQAGRNMAEERTESEPHHAVTAYAASDSCETGSAGGIVTPGLPDAAFRRLEGVPMTKSEVRAVCLSKLQLTRDAVCWDVGAGSGSVAIEMALQAAGGQVYAIERKAAAASLIRENCAALGVKNVNIVEGNAPEACAALPAPTHAFIGGSDGNAAAIMEVLLAKNPRVHIVATAVTLETIGNLTECAGRFTFSEVEIVELQVSRGKNVGQYHLMSAQNPVYIFALQREKS